MISKKLINGKNRRKVQSYVYSLWPLISQYFDEAFSGKPIGRGTGSLALFTDEYLDQTSDREEYVFSLKFFTTDGNPAIDITFRFDAERLLLQMSEMKKK